MAEINIERKPQRSPWPIVLAVLAVLVIAAAIWYFTQQPAGSSAVPPGTGAADTVMTGPPPGTAA